MQSKPSPEEKVCKRCHLLKAAREFVANKWSPDGLKSICKGCVGATRRRHYLANAERLRARSAAYRASNPEAVRAYSARYRAEHAVELKAYRESAAYKALAKAWKVNRASARAAARRYARRHPERVKADCLRRRARNLAAPGSCSAVQLAARIGLFQWCAYCGGPVQHIDHVIPLSRGGSNWPANLVPACAPCNLSKNKRTFREWGRTPTVPGPRSRLP